MGTFDDVMENARYAAHEAGKKISNTADIAGLKLQEASIRRDMRAVYEKMGKDMYKKIADGIVSSEGYKKEVSLLDELSTQLKMVKQLIEKAKGSIKCPVCGQSCTNDSIYCKKCGNKLK